MGVGLGCWALGEVLHTLDPSQVTTGTSPGASDYLWLVFYRAAFLTLARQAYRVLRSPPEPKRPRVGFSFMPGHSLRLSVGRSILGRGQHTDMRAPPGRRRTEGAVRT